MNEQDLILKQKIEKREKFDIILAYILLVVLLGFIFLILYLKFIRKDDMVKPEEYTPKYISLNEISTALNSSTLANLYLNEAANFSSSVLNDVLSITYSKDDTNIDLNIPLVGNELEVILTEENNVISGDIYKEIASIICMYYGNSESKCRNTINNITENNQVEGIRFVKNENNNHVYISINKSINTSDEIIYNNVTKTTIDQKNYILNLDGLKIYNIDIDKGTTNFTLSGTIERINNENENISLIVKLYDKTDNIISENKYSYNKELPLEGKSNFTISFELNEEQLSSISLYTIEIEK